MRRVLLSLASQKRCKSAAEMFPFSGCDSLHSCGAVVFARVLEGILVVRSIEAMGSSSGTQHC